MQQTTTYKLNLIEPSDTFSPDPLNDNTRKLETALTAETAARTSEDAALAGRVTALASRLASLEAHKYVIDHYVGTGEHGTRTFTLGFYPQFLLIVGARIGLAIVARAQPLGNTVNITETGFTIYYPENNSPTLNYGGDRYFYLAFL